MAFGRRGGGGRSACQQSGSVWLSEVQPGQEYTNAERIMHEWHDFLAAIEMLIESGDLKSLPDAAAAVRAKKIKVEKFLRYSAECGTLN